MRSLLKHRIGEAAALPLDQLVALAGLPNRRAAEALMETRLDDFGFPLCAGSGGYFVPQTPEEINHYLASLKSRIRCIAIRLRTVRQNAQRAGWARDGKQFSAPPARREFLFDVPACAGAQQ
ncbi:MAG: hypothetical protein NTY53_20865 [Kiritimatiellaeota bacterium]|nr:hypothetical protein [Kiritimatiellota bacterium]